MNLRKMPDDPLERLAFYQRERAYEQAEAKRISDKIERGESLSEREEVYWAFTRYGGASRCGY